MRGHRGSAAVVVLGLLAGSIAVGAAAAPAAVAEVRSDDVAYQVTFVSRVCPAYSDIMANRARNNIQESLRDLGKDTVYTAGQPISPSIEAANNPRCVPLADWQFALGTGFTGKTSGTDYLSTITGDYGQTIRVKPTTPELDRLGQDTGRNLEDAVTVTLTADQARRAQQSNSLWTQGGTKADPLLHSVFGDDYGFGALRCSVDNLNGDNVEWIGFPSGSRHVFCYYYAITPPPDAGTIVVAKRLAAGSNGPATFRYVGNISYTTTNDFFLSPQNDTTPVSASFVRAAGDAWDFEEQNTDGFILDSLTCAESAGSGSSWTIAGAKATVRVGDGATVTCTYVNREVEPATGLLQVSKVTDGGVGSFPFRVQRDGTTVLDTVATTVQEGERVVVGATSTAPTGEWSVRETLPAPTALGTWAIDSVECDGSAVAFVESAGPGGTTYVTSTETLADGATRDCLFSNVFTPGGEIQIAKRTTDGVGRFAFPVFRADQFDETGEPTALYSAYLADVTAQGTATTAAPLPGFDSLTDLPVGEGASSTYYIGELSPTDTERASWRPTRVTCTDLDDGSAVPYTGDVEGRVVRLELTAAHPRVRCVADNALLPIGTLSVTKTIEGPDAGKQDAVRLDIRCADGTRERFTIPAGSTGTTTIASPVVLRDDTSCTVREARTGENPSAERSSTTFAVDGGPRTEAISLTVDVASGDRVTVAVVDEYGGLAPSGVTPGTRGYALAGLLLVGLGTLIYAASGRLGRTS